MRAFIRKVFSFEIEKKIFAILSVLVLAALVLPIARIMMYSVPWYDDFSYGRLTKVFWEMKNSFWDAVKGAFYSARSIYHSWQGTFSSCFLMSMMPAVWGTDKYVFGLWFILGIFILGIFSLVGALLRFVLRVDRWTTLSVQAIVAATCVLLFRSPIDGLFWYNAGMHYTVMHSIGVMLIAFLIYMIYIQNSPRKVGGCMILSVIVAYVVGGGNYVTILQMGLTMVSLIGWGILFKKRTVWRVIPATVVMGIAMTLNMTAPGNAKRAAILSELSQPPLWAIGNSFKSALTYFDDFTGWMTLAVILLLIPIIVRIVVKTDFQFRYPGLVLLWSFCLYATGFTPTLFTMGHTLLSRATNMTKYTFQLLLFVNVFYLLGWFCKWLVEKKGKEIMLKNSLCYYALIVLLMLGIFVAEPNKGGVYTTYCAYYFVHTGEAYNYHQEYLQRVALCESEETDVVVRPYVFKPWVLCLGDLSADPNYEPNKFMAEFYGKNSIICLSEEEEQALK